MKKNLIFASVFLGVIMISLVSAGWFTGYGVKNNTAPWGANYCKEGVNLCLAGQGDCDRNQDCKTGYCAKNVGDKPAYGQKKGMDVCECVVGKVWDATSETCVDADASCSIVEGVVQDQARRQFRDTCSGKTYKTYSCNAAGTEVVESSVLCAGNCKNSVGCVKACLGETDEANDVNVGGSVSLDDGTSEKDKCVSGRTVKQFVCISGLLENAGTTDCGLGKECYDNEGKEEAYCRDVIAGTATIASLQSDITDLRALIVDLTSRIVKLEA